MNKVRLAFIPYNESKVNFDTKTVRIGELIVNGTNADMKLVLNDGTISRIKGSGHYELLEFIKNGISVGSTIDDNQIMMIDTSLTEVPEDAIKGILKVKHTGEDGEVKVKAISFLVNADNTLINEDNKNITLQDFFDRYNEYVETDTNRYNELVKRLESLETHSIDKSVFQASYNKDEDISIKIAIGETGASKDKYSLLEVMANVDEDINRFQLLISYLVDGSIKVKLNNIGAKVSKKIDVYIKGSNVYLKVPVSDGSILIRDITCVNNDFVRFVGDISKILSSTVSYNDNELLESTMNTEEALNSVRYIQNNHGFTGVTPVYYNNGLWAKASEENPTEALAIIINEHVLRVYTSGHIDVTGMKNGNLSFSKDKYYNVGTVAGQLVETSQGSSKVGYTYDLDGRCYFVLDVYVNSSHDTDGYMSKEDKIKMDGIEANANKYIHPETHSANMITEETDIRFINDEEQMRLRASKNAPHDSIHGSLYVEKGQVYASGAFKRLKGLDKAKVDEWGVVSTPDNSLSFIAQDGYDGIYIGPAYKNIVGLSYSPSIGFEVDYKGRYFEYTNKSTQSIYYHSILMRTDLKASTAYSIKYEVLEGFEYLSRVLVFGSTFDGIGSAQPLTDKNFTGTFTTKDVMEGNAVIVYMDAHAPLNSKLKIRIQVTEGTEEKPYIPPQASFPGGALYFEGTEGMNFTDYSYLMKDIVAPTATYPHLVRRGTELLIVQASNKDVSDIVYSSLYDRAYGTQGEYNVYIENTTERELLTFAGNNMNPLNQNYGFSQLIAYKGSLTQAELNAELAKDLEIPGAINITERIKRNMLATQIFGSLYGGYLNNNQTKVKDNIYADIKTMSMYKCLHDNTDESATVENYIPYTLDTFMEDINTRQTRYVPSLPTDAKNIDEAISELYDTKLEKDAKASAETLGAIKIGAGFRILEDGTLILANIQRESRYDGKLNAGDTTIQLPDTMNPSVVTRVYINGVLLQPTTHYTIDTTTRIITVLNPYKYDAEVTVLNYDGYQSGEYSEADKVKLGGIEVGANKYIHPETHPASMITEEVDKRFMTSEEKAKIVNVQSELDSRIDTIIEVHQGKLRMMSKSGVKIKDLDKTLNYNDNGVCRSLDGSASFKVCEDSLYLGAGYENLYKNGNLGVSNNPTILENGFEVTLVRNDGNHHTCTSSFKIPAYAKYTVSFDLELLSGTLSGSLYPIADVSALNRGDLSWNDVRRDFTTEEKAKLANGTKVHISKTCLNFDKDCPISRIWTGASEEDPATVRFTNFQVTLSEDEKPYVRDKAYSGNLQLENTEDFNFDDYSIIATGVSQNIENGRYQNCLFRSPSVSIFQHDTVFDSKWLYSSEYQNNITISSTHRSMISFGYYINMNGYVSAVNFSKFLLYKGTLTQKELEDEYAKINHIDNILDNVPDVYGDTYTDNFADIIDMNTDIPYILNKYYNIVTNDNKTYSYYVDGNGNMYNNIVMKDVSGYIRLYNVEFPCKLSISDNKHFSSVNNVRELPDPSLYGSIRVLNGRLLTSGVFNNIHGLDKAKVEEYGDTKIITTPDNSFNCIIYKDSKGIDRIYTGEGYKNEFQALSISSTVSLKYINDGYYEMKQISPAETRHNFVRLPYNKEGTISIELDSPNQYVRGSKGGTYYPFDTEVKWTYYDHTVLGNTGISFTQGTPIGTKVRFRIQVTEGPIVKPIIPPQYVFPDGRMKFDGTENLSLDDDSFILYNPDNGNDSKKMSILQKNYRTLTVSDYSTGEPALCSPSHKSNCGLGDVVGAYPILQIGYDNPEYKSHGLSQLNYYKGNLTKAELENELNKNMAIPGEVDIIDIIKNNTNNTYLMGKDYNGILNNTITKIKDNLYFDIKTTKVYRCTSNNEYDYAHADCYVPISLDDLRRLVDTKQSSTDNNLQTASKTVVGAITELLNLISLRQTATDSELETVDKTIVGAINELNHNLNNLDLSPYQTKTDGSLPTTDKTIVGAITELKNNEWKINAKPIGNTETVTDLNDITTPGWYKVSSNNYELQNSPLGATHACMLQVLSIDEYSNWNFIQIVIDYSGNRMYKRYTTNNGETWSAWKRLADEDDIALCLPKTGGTIDGNLVVTNTIYCNNNITAFSDIRLKENIERIDNAISKIQDINGYTFNMKANPNLRMTGVIAQELEKVLPEAVVTNPEGYKSVAYGNIVGLLIEAVKEQEKKIERLEKGEVM